MIGYLLEQELRRQASARSVATLLTQTVVASDDPSLAMPTKPVGPVYDEATALQLRNQRGFAVARDTGGWRRVVPSPRPLRLLEERSIRLLVDAGVTVITSGGGGVPVIVDVDGRPQGVEAVVDKDLAAVVLARAVGADILLLLTDVDRVYTAFGTPDAHGHDELTSRTGPISRARAGACSRKHAPEGGCLCGVRRFRRHRDHRRARPRVRCDPWYRRHARGAELGACRCVHGVSMTSRVPAVAAGAGTVVGCAAWLAGFGGAASAIWAATTLLLLVPLTWSVVKTLARGDVGVDAIALLAMGGALAVGEYLAGAVIAVMLAGGNALEAYAQGRAGRELSALVSKIPTTARVRRGDDVVTVPVDRLDPGDRMVVNTGDTVAADAQLVSAHAVFDTSSLTGEPLPVDAAAGAQVASGSVNAGPPVELDAIRRAGESTYAAIVRLVESAQGSKAPFVRMADRYAVWFLGVTVALAAGAWLASGDPVRAVAVLVVATPCPLILAAPVALVSGVSRAARAGVIVKGAGVIERLAAARTVLLDKTGTLTLGTPVVDAVHPQPISGASSSSSPRRRWIRRPATSSRRLWWPKPSAARCRCSTRWTSPSPRGRGFADG